MMLGALARAVVLKVYARLVAPVSDLRSKRAEELAYWQRVRASEVELKNWWYEKAFTDAFGLEGIFYRGKRILDIGCGPSGSLEWADMAAERVGLDPLADSYKKLRSSKHKMVYVAACSEAIPFPDAYFDVVSSFNSLDHVDDLEATIREIERVTADTLLLVTDVNHAPTRAEPQTFSWNIVGKFTGFQVTDLRRYEKDDRGIYASIERAVPYNDEDQRPRYGVLLARLTKTSVALCERASLHARAQANNEPTPSARATPARDDPSFDPQ